MRDGQGTITYFVSTGRDITERRQLEEQFRQAQKMEAIGRLAGGIAHDFNNLLTIINGFGELLLVRQVPGEVARTYLEEIRAAGQRAASLTRQLLAFSRRQVLAPKILNLNTTVADTEKMLRRLIGEDIELITVLDPDLGQITADPGQLEQVLMNLVVNARDAMPQGGRLTVETANVELNEAYAQTHVEVQRGPYAMLAVRDTGIGMDAATMARIFEPFFTTKEPGKGTGLGLSTVYGIVKQSQGHIEVFSTPGQGATFKVYLPRVAQAVVETARSSATLTAPEGGSETILVVEDEAMVRTLVRGVLKAGGYTVLDAPDGPEALRVVERHRGPIHLLLTDLVMPGMSGRELAERLAPRQPNTKVLFMSGYTDDTVIRHGLDGTGNAFLQKPFTPDGLLQTVPLPSV